MHDELFITEGLLTELAEEGLNFSLTTALHEVEGFHKPKNAVRFADGSWVTKSAELVMEALERHGELVEFTLKVTGNDSTTASGRRIPGEILGLVGLNLEAGTACIAEFKMGTSESMFPFCDTAYERAQEVAGELVAA